MVDLVIFPPPADRDLKPENILIDTDGYLKVCPVSPLCAAPGQFELWPSM